MLVISRKNGQKLMINDNIVITIVEARNGVCKLAIDADRDVKIYREEISVVNFNNRCSVCGGIKIKSPGLIIY